MKKFLLLLVGLFFATLSMSADKLAYQIDFGGTSNTTSKNTSNFINDAVLASSKSLISKVTTCSNVFVEGNDKIKLSSSKNGGALTFELSQPVNATKVVVTASPYSSSENTFSFGSTSCTANSEKETIEISLTGSLLSSMSFSASKRAIIHSVAVYVKDENPTEKTAVTLSFPDTKYTAEKSEGFNAPKLTAQPAAAADAVSYSSSETSVATVNAAGEVTLVGAGTTTITAAIANHATYADVTASYELTVTETTQGGDSDAGKYVLVNSSTDLTTGAKYVIAHYNTSDNKYYAMNTTVTSNKVQSDAVTVTDNKLTPVETTAIFELVADGEKWKLKCTNDGKYLNVATSGTNLNFNTTGSSNTIKFDGDYVQIDNNRRVFPQNNGYGSYATSNWNVSGYYKPSLYKFVENTDPQPGEKTDAPISFSAESATGEFGDGVGVFTSDVPTFSNASNLSVAFDSSNKQVATVDASGNVTIVGVGETVISATFAGNDSYNETTAKYTLTVTAKQTVDPNPGNMAAYTITFDNNGNSDATTDVTWNSLKDYITTGADYIEEATGISKVYKGKNGLKFGSSSAVGTITFALTEKGKVNATKIVVNASAYNTSDVALAVNGKSTTLSGTTLKDYEFDVTGPIESISLATSNIKDYRAYVKGITIYYEDNTSAGENPGLSFRYSKVVGKAGVGFAAQAAYHVSPGKVTYTSSNPAVVDVVAETGMFDINKPCNVGTTTITAEIEAAEGYAAGKASYDVVIEPIGQNDVSALFNFNEPATLSPSYPSVTNSTTVSDVVFTSDNVTIYGTKGTNNDCVLVPSGSNKANGVIEFRIYQGAKLNVSTTDGSYITKVDFGFSVDTQSNSCFYRSNNSSVKYGPTYSQEDFTATADEKLTTVDFFVMSGGSSYNVYLDYINVETTSMGGGDNHFVLSFNDEDRVISTFVGEKTELPELQIPTEFDKSAKITYSIDDPDAEGFDYTIAEENGKMFVTMHDEPGVYTLRASSEKTATQAASTAILRMNVFPTLTVAPASPEANVDDARGTNNYNLTLVQPDESDNAEIKLPSIDELTQTEEGASRYSTVAVTKVTVKVGEEVKVEYTAADNFAGMDTYTFEDDGVVEYTFQYGGTERFEHTAVVNVVMMPQKPATVADESTKGSQKAYIVTPSKNAKLQYYTYTAPKQSNKVSGLESSYAEEEHEWITSDEPSMTFTRPDDLSPDLVFTAYYRSMKNISAIVPDDPELVSPEDVVNIASNGTLVGVEQVDADNANAETEYFDLQGRRVMNPTNGLYIRKQGTTVEKVIL